MFETLLSTLSSAVALWLSKEKTKYIDSIARIRKAYYAEYNKDPAYRSDAALDHLEFELRVLADAFNASVGKQNSAAQPNLPGI